MKIITLVEEYSFLHAPYIYLFNIDQYWYFMQTYLFILLNMLTYLFMLTYIFRFLKYWYTLIPFNLNPSPARRVESTVLNQHFLTFPKSVKPCIWTFSSNCRVSKAYCPTAYFIKKKIIVFLHGKPSLVRFWKSAYRKSTVRVFQKWKGCHVLTILINCFSLYVGYWTKKSFQNFTFSCDIFRVGVDLTPTLQLKLDSKYLDSHHVSHSSRW